MRQAKTFSLVALATVFAAVAGTQMGREAVSEIDPLFFTAKPEPVPYLESAESAPVRPLAADLAMPGYFYAIPGRKICWGCPGQADPYLDAYVQPFVDPVEAPLPPPRRAAVRHMEEVGPADRPAAAQLTSLDRYLSFPVAEDEAQRVAHIQALPAAAETGDEQAAQPQPLEM